MRHEIRAQEVCNRRRRRREGNWPSPRTRNNSEIKKSERKKWHNVGGNETFPIGQPVGKSRQKNEMEKLNCGALGSLRRDVISGLRVWERGLLFLSF
jgi:hypothetical protein